MMAKRMSMQVAVLSSAIEDQVTSEGGGGGGEEDQVAPLTEVRVTGPLER